MFADEEEFVPDIDEDESVGLVLPEDEEEFEEEVEDEENEENEEEDLDLGEDEEFEEEIEEDSTIESRPRFDSNQQKEVDRILKTRLERQEASMLRNFKEVAGVDIEKEELTSATRLWGLLKTNPELSGEIDKVIDQHLREGKAKPPSHREVSSREAELDFKEAVLDMKSEDKLFSKHSDKILDWAENEGFEVHNAKTLKLAYMAWKGSQGSILEATKKLNEEKKKSERRQIQKKATVQSSKPGKQKAKLDFSKMSDADIIANEGLSLFTDD